jgi:hypothetical protein
MELHEEIWCVPGDSDDALRLMSAVRDGWDLADNARSETVDGSHFTVYSLSRPCTPLHVIPRQERVQRRMPRAAP